MQQSLHLLQAPVLELRALVQQEMQSNPVLEEPHEEPTEQEEDWDHELDEMRRNDEDWRDYFSQTSQQRRVSSDDQEKRQFFFDSLVEQESLADHLMGQMTLATESEEILRAGEEIIGNLDEKGFLKATLQEVANSSRTSLETTGQALSLIQTFHPPGIAARDLRETLLIQLKQKGKEGGLEWGIVSGCLDELGRKRFAEIAKKLENTVERVQEAANYISTLQPRPGAAFAPDQPQNVIQPEAAIVKSDDGKWIVQMNHDPVPRLRICDTYKDLLGKSEKDPNLRDYLKDKIRSGKFLIKCLHQRQDTIENILKEIVARQNDFLETGVSALKPLTMSQVAQVVGVHETTVSRAIANKYVQTPWGIFPIKFFFTYGYQTDGGQTMSNTSIKEAIGDLINREDRAKPLADSEIVKILGERGIPLARRTVAKYRTELRILPSNLRRNG